MQYSTDLLRHWPEYSSLPQRGKMTLHKLAKLTGISELLLDHYELGKSEIGLDALLRIACALDVELSGLVGDGF